MPSNSCRHNPFPAEKRYLSSNLWIRASIDANPAFKSFPFNRRLVLGELVGEVGDVAGNDNKVVTLLTVNGEQSFELPFQANALIHLALNQSPVEFPSGSDEDVKQKWNDFWARVRQLQDRINTELEIDLEGRAIGASFVEHHMVPRCLQLEWLHEATDRYPAEDLVYNPVVGYRVHRVDRYDPRQHVRHKQQGSVTALLPTPETRVQVLPIETYRAQPSTIEARLVEADVEQDGPQSRSWSPIAMSEPVWRHDPASKLQWGYVGDERPGESGGSGRIMHQVGPVYLAQPILDCLHAVADVVDRRRSALSKVNVMLSTHEPLQYASMEALLGAVPKHAVFKNGIVAAAASDSLTIDANADQVWSDNQWKGKIVTILSGNAAQESRIITSNTGNQLKVAQEWASGKTPQRGSRFLIVEDDASLASNTQAKVQHLTETLDETSDPYGWLAAEAMGLSCECRLVDEHGEPVSVQELFGMERDRDMNPFFVQMRTALIESALPTGGQVLASTDAAMRIELPSQWKDRFVRITGGKGKGQVREIDAVTDAQNHITLRVDRDWDEHPDSSSTFAITETEHSQEKLFDGIALSSTARGLRIDRFESWKDQFVHIIDGTGKGQAHEINRVQIGQNHITIYVKGNWQTKPDATSIYRVGTTSYVTPTRVAHFLCRRRW